MGCWVVERHIEMAKPTKKLFPFYASTKRHVLGVPTVNHDHVDYKVIVNRKGL